MIDISSRLVLTEKAPFWVRVSEINTSVFGNELLVRPCLSKKDPGIALEEGEINFENIKLEKEIKEYYIVLKGGYFMNNLVYKSICERIKKTN